MVRAIRRVTEPIGEIQVAVAKIQAKTIAGLAVKARVTAWANGLGIQGEKDQDWNKVMLRDLIGEIERFAAA